MASLIDPANPAQGNATTQSVRDNFAAAKSEIEALQVDDAAAAALLAAAIAAEATARDAAIAAAIAALPPSGIPNPRLLWTKKNASLAAVMSITLDAAPNAPASWRSLHAYFIYRSGTTTGAPAMTIKATSDDAAETVSHTYSGAALTATSSMKQMQQSTNSQFSRYAGAPRLDITAASSTAMNVDVLVFGYDLALLP